MTDFNGNLLSFFGRKWLVVFSHPILCWDVMAGAWENDGDLHIKNTTRPEIFGKVYTK